MTVPLNAVDGISLNCCLTMASAADAAEKGTPVPFTTNQPIVIDNGTASIKAPF
jgi:hypothetical protein